MTPEEFEYLYRATSADVLGYVRRRSAADADDLVAEVYAVAWRRRADLPAPMLRRAWLFGVARTLLKAAGRERQRDRELLDELARPASDADEPTSADRTAATVAGALKRLAPRHREVLQLVTWEGLTPAELAVALGIRPGAARVRLHRARQAFAADPEVRALVGDASAFSNHASAYGLSL
jgi:RNA polymerase sigma-70 factor, ECF subfamily